MEENNYPSTGSLIDKLGVDKIIKVREFKGKQLNLQFKVRNLVISDEMNTRHGLN